MQSFIRRALSSALLTSAFALTPTARAEQLALTCTGPTLTLELIEQNLDIAGVRIRENGQLVDALVTRTAVATNASHPTRYESYQGLGGAQDFVLSERVNAGDTADGWEVRIDRAAVHAHEFVSCVRHYPPTATPVTCPLGYIRSCHWIGREQAHYSCSCYKDGIGH